MSQVEFCIFFQLIGDCLSFLVWLKNIRNLNLTFLLFWVIMIIVFTTKLGDKMKHENKGMSKVPRPSRVFQMGILGHIECRFQDLVQISCSSSRDAKQQICKSKVLLLDIRHIILYQSFDYDLREKIMMRADAVVNYINSFMNALSRDGSHVVARQLVGAYA